MYPIRTGRGLRQWLCGWLLTASRVEGPPSFLFPIKVATINEIQANGALKLWSPGAVRDRLAACMGGHATSCLMRKKKRILTRFVWGTLAQSSRGGRGSADRELPDSIELVPGPRPQ